MFTRPAPKSAKAQVEFLYTRAKKSTKALAEQLGVSPRTVQRYRAGQQTKPQKKLRAALVEETESQWQPQVRAQAREHEATTSGMQVEVYAYFGSSSFRRPVRRRKTCIRSSRRPLPSRISTAR